MEKNFDMEKAQRMAATPAARQLFSLLSENGTDMRQVAQRAAAGDLTQVQQLMKQLMADDRAKELLQQLQGEYHG